MQFINKVQPFIVDLNIHTINAVVGFHIDCCVFKKTANNSHMLQDILVAEVMLPQLLYDKEMKRKEKNVLV